MLGGEENGHWSRRANSTTILQLSDSPYGATVSAPSSVPNMFWRSRLHPKDSQKPLTKYVRTKLSSVWLRHAQPEKMHTNKSNKTNKSPLTLEHFSLQSPRPGIHLPPRQHDELRVCWPTYVTAIRPIWSLQSCAFRWPCRITIPWKAQQCYCSVACVGHCRFIDWKMYDDKKGNSGPMIKEQKR